MTMFPASATAEGRQFNGAPFPASATAEGAQLNVPPSPGIMRQYERKSHERQSHAGRYGLLGVSRSIDRSPTSFILLHASFVLLYKVSWKRRADPEGRRAHFRGT